MNNVKHFFKMTLILSFIFVLGQPMFPDGMATDVKAMEKMYAYADSQLLQILECIPADREKGYGFENREEFQRAALGIPYQEYSLDSEAPTGYWRIPVTVDGVNRALLRLIIENGQWTFAGFSGARLAQELGRLEREFGETKPVNGRIIRDFTMQCDYVQFNQTAGAEIDGLLRPMESAMRMLDRLVGGVIFHGYSLEKIKELRFQISRTRPDRTPSAVN